MIAAAIVLCTVASYGIGWVAAVPALVPLLNTAASVPFMVLALKRGDLQLAIARMLLWALTMAVCATALSYARPVQTDTLFLRGAAYRTEMFTWVMTGRGAESTPSVFIPQQIGHTALFVTLALVTGGTVAMLMGAALMNYMGHYVGTLAANSARPAATVMLGWHPWAVIRVISFVVLGVILAVPLLSRVTTLPRLRSVRPYLVAASCGLVLDVVLKWLLAPLWQRLLLRVVGW